MSTPEPKRFSDPVGQAKLELASALEVAANLGAALAEERALRAELLAALEALRADFVPGGHLADYVGHLLLEQADTAIAKAKEATP